MAEFDFIQAAYGRPHKRVPIWIMRQAGRYLPQFQAVREKASFVEVCRSPELTTEVTLQPIDIFGFDAAILFSDILLPLEPLGVDVSYDGNGPHIMPPVRTPDDVARLAAHDPVAEMSYVLAGVKSIKERLAGRVPLIGFCGAPFTLACYLVEGGSSTNYSEIKKFLYTYPTEASALLSRLAELTGRYLKAQIEVGVEAVQLFDSWAGILAPEQYRAFALPYIKTVFDICQTPGVPRILYMNNSAPYLEYLAEVDCEVVSIDWRTDITTARQVLEGKAIQGNLDPHVLFASGDVVCREARRLLEATAESDGFIFNLGQGILPGTPVENVRLLVETVHDFDRRRDATLYARGK